uniref:Uncharacterized protein n=1 Tax=Rhizophora mucronata TaxID=61149 RepID=A0A2P2IM24_RHIMU
MGHDAVDSAKTGGKNLGENKPVDDKGESKKGDDMKTSVKDLNNDELEAMFFPHHKLLRT